MHKIGLLAVLSLGLVACKMRSQDSKGKIVDGSEIKSNSQNDIPEVIEITASKWREDGWYSYFNRDPIASCTGVVIGPNVVLTAAHCISDLRSGGVTARQWIIGPRRVFLDKLLLAKINDGGYKSPMEFLMAAPRDKDPKKISISSAEFSGSNGATFGPRDIAVLVYEGTNYAPTPSGGNFFPSYLRIGYGRSADGATIVGFGQSKLGQYNDEKKRRADVTISSTEGGMLHVTSSQAGLWSWLLGGKQLTTPQAGHGDSGGPILVKDSRTGEIVVAGIAHGGVFRLDDKIYGNYEDLPNGKFDLVEGFWVDLSTEISRNLLKDAVNGGAVIDGYIP